MESDVGKMEEFDFLLGDWNLEYRVPKSPFGEADTGSGEGTIKRALGGRYVFFDYHAVLKKSGEGAAHAVFAWDGRANVFRYWWFEDSGSFLAATGDFVDEGTLRLNWHDTLLVQTFQKQGPDQLILRMERPVSGGAYEVILEVLFTRKYGAFFGTNVKEREWTA
jgi:hypothetical protein